MKNHFHFLNKTNYYRTYNHPYPAFKALSSEKVPLSIHSVIKKIILDKLIHLCYNVFKIRGQGTETKAGSD